MLVSVIIPTYNRAGYIGSAVRSVLTQSFRDLELIVVDDGSTDATREILSGFDDKRLKAVYQENSGVAAARNLGLDLAGGRYVAFLDSDDFWLERKLELQLAFMHKSGFCISQTQEAWIRKGKRVNPGHRHQKFAGWIFARSLKMCLVSPSCVMMHSDLVRQGFLFNESLPACEDYDLWLRISLSYPVGLLSRVLTVKQGGRGDQLSRSIIGLDLWRIQALLDILNGEKLQPEKKALVLQALQEKSRVYIAGCQKRGRLEEAARIKEKLDSCLNQVNLRER
ncbi:glycosyltransferase [Desulfonatronospira sp. MSAO_Bac3]|uniref:glycosyltransferase family 2 protein n=1 Tax=Desulfonatronospira sp. MSAO_Bac3 TaxID=2293857 RepID=UPI000FF359A3|nr:glycosyltransferase [Desulfonatronospira sp. MSAO_Bac3]RQD79580.1 MAG: glycosyltransferase [Desulfonatronospira sp. MSAO_Bac3]